MVRSNGGIVSLGGRGIEIGPDGCVTCADEGLFSAVSDAETNDGTRHLPKEEQPHFESDPSQVLSGFPLTRKLPEPTGRDILLKTVEAVYGPRVLCAFRAAAGQ